MPGIGISDLSGLFVDYRGGFIDALNTKTLARRLFLGKNWRWEGSASKKNIRVARNTGMSWSQDGGAYPTGQGEVYVESEIGRRYMPAQTVVTEGALATAKTDRRAAVSTVKQIMKGMRESVSEMQDFMMMRDGTAAVATVDTNQGTSTTTLRVNDARGLWRNQSYAVYDSTYATLRGYIKISSVTQGIQGTSPSTYFEATCTANVPTGTTGTDKIVWAPGNVSAYNNAWTGLDAMVADGTGTFQGVSGTTYPEWTSTVITASSYLSTRLMRQLLASIHQRCGKEDLNLFALTSTWDVLEFEELFLGDIRITPSAKVEGIRAPVFQTVFGKVMPYASKNAPYGTLFAIDRTQISRAVQKELDWQSGTKGIFMPSTEFMGFYASMTEISELAIEDRRACGKIDTLTTDAQYV